MNKLILTVFLAIGMVVNAQNREYFKFNVEVDPSATVKEKSPNLNFSLEVISYWKYAKVSTQFLPGLKGGYLDFGGGVGITTTVDRFDKVRVYGGGRLGLIKRGFNENKTFTYPLAGLEAGVDYNINDNISIGVRSTGDYRSDFKYSGANPSMRYSSFLKIGFTL